MLADTHCHLNLETYNNDRVEVLERARIVGVGRILVPGIDLASSRKAVNLADTYTEVFAAVGVHPNDAMSWDENTFNELRELARHPKVIAIGEIGLDYYRQQTPQDLQRQVFRQQLDLAVEAGLPVVVHIRNTALEDHRATVDVLNIFKGWQSELVRSGSNLADCPGVLHSFSDGEEAAKEALRLNFRIGITGPVTFRNAAVLQQVVRSLPLEQLLIETDAPFLTPHPHRGQRNEPANVRFVAEKIAQLRSLSYDDVAKGTSLNAKRLFNW